MDNGGEKNLRKLQCLYKVESNLNIQRKKNKNINLKIWEPGLLSLVWFYGISTAVDYLMPCPVYTNIWDIYDL